MLQKIRDLFCQIKTAYTNRKNGNCCQLTGDFNIALRLHKKDTPDKSANLTANGGGTLALLDVGLFLAALALILSAVRCVSRLCRKF